MMGNCPNRMGSPGRTSRFGRGVKPEYSDNCEMEPIPTFGPSRTKLRATPAYRLLLTGASRAARHMLLCSFAPLYTAGKPDLVQLTLLLALMEALILSWDVGSVNTEYSLRRVSGEYPSLLIAAHPTILRTANPAGHGLCSQNA